MVRDPFKKKSVVRFFFFLSILFQNNSKSNQLHFNNLKQNEIIKIYVYKIGDTSFNFQLMIIFLDYRVFFFLFSSKSSEYAF